MTTKFEQALERSKKVHPRVWRVERWTWEVIQLGVVLAGLIAGVGFAALFVRGTGGPAELLAALGVSLPNP